MKFADKIQISPEYELCEITNEHINELFVIYSDAEILHYTDSDIHNNISDTQKLIDKIKKARIDNTKLYFGINSVNETKLIGTVGIYDINFKHSFASIGCILHKNYWRKGIMTKALQALIKYSFEEIKLNRLEAQVFENHIASANLFRKLNFKEDGILRQNFLIDGKFENSIMFSKLKND